MRIISGKYRGRTLKSLQGETTRPTTDRVKESLFDIIQFCVKDSVVLDLFAGSGALGIECLSRGAKRAVFCDVDKGAVEIVKQNLKNIDGNYKIFNCDFTRVLKAGDKYDIIFIDAPYRSGLAYKALELIVSEGVLEEDGIICCERLFELPVEIPSGLERRDSRKYGITALDFIGYAKNGSNNG